MSLDSRTLSSVILNKAIELGASQAGIANIEDLKQSPSFLVTPKRPHIDRVGAVENETGLPEGEVAWPQGMKSVLVITYRHPENQPYLDCWLDWKNPPGNIALANINKNLKKFLDEQYPQVQAIPMNYYVEKGGVWLKDAAAIAGLGVLGKNNLLITPRFGPRVRIRAMYLSLDLPSTGPLQNWDPCEGCPMPCRAKCPQHSFDEIIYDPEEYDGIDKLPGRTGCYNLLACDKQMATDEKNEDTSGVQVENYGLAKSVVKYCRECECNCLVGKGF